MTEPAACLFIILHMQPAPNMTKENQRTLSLIIHLVSTYETNLNKEKVLDYINYIYVEYKLGGNVNAMIEKFHDDLLCDIADAKTYKQYLFLCEYGRV